MSIKLRTKKERLGAFALALAIMPAAAVGCAMDTSDPSETVGSHHDRLSGAQHSTDKSGKTENSSPQTCEDFGYECGLVANEDGRALDCGSCAGDNEV